MEDLRLGRRIVYDVKANWKLIIQNYNECLHCPNLHPALNKLSHYLSGENEPLHATYMGGRMDLRPGVETLSVDGICRAGAPAGLAGDDRRRVYYYAIFPNMLLSLHPDYMMVHTLWPIAPDRTLNVCEWHFQPAELARPDFDAVGRDRFLGPHEPAGLACVRAVAGRDLVTRLHAGTVLEPRRSALCLRPDDCGTARSHERRQGAHTSSDRDQGPAST